MIRRILVVLLSVFALVSVVAQDNDLQRLFEDEDLEFHRRVRGGYLELAAASPERFRVVDASGEPESIASAVRP